MKQPNTPGTNFFLNTAIGFSSSDVIDRIVLAMTKFTHTDLILIPATIIIAYHHYNSEKKNAT